MNNNVGSVLIVLAVLGGFYFYLQSTSSVAEPAPANTTLASVATEAPSLQGIAARFDKHLFVLGPHGDVHGFDSAKLTGVKYFAFYYSASWCPPCRAFTPDLVQFYNDFKPAHPNFELIFVGRDASDGDMVNYMKSDSMPWPAVWYQDNDDRALNAKQYMGSGIPDLVLVDAYGRILADSFRGGRYVGPRYVMQEIQQVVP